VLADIRWKGQPHKTILWANRNGLLYVLDRATGQLLMGMPFVEVNWMSGFDEKGRPQRVVNQVVNETSPMRPGNAATNWYPPAYSPRTTLFYVPASEHGAIKPGSSRRGPAYGAVRAFDPSTGERSWEFIAKDAIFQSGVLATASDLLFVGTTGDNSSGADAARLADGYLHALDARTGQSLWKIGLAGSIGPVVTYEVDGRQYLAVAAGTAFFALALRAPK
jgi:glucose dehydrogenase